MVLLKLRWRIVSIAIAIAEGVALGGCAWQGRTTVGVRPDLSLTAVQNNRSNQDSGWYLIQPPRAHSSGNHPSRDALADERMPDPSAKLWDWQVIAFFNRTQNCDAARESSLRAYPSVPTVAAPSTSGPNSVQVGQMLAASSLCVSTRDPKLDRWAFWKISPENLF